VISPTAPARFVVALICLLAWPAQVQAQGACSAAPLGVQVLGSGGMFPNSQRAAASYLIWRAGRPIVMIDAGEGSLRRLVDAGGDLAQLQLLAISRADSSHIVDLARLLELRQQAGAQPLGLIGPESGGALANLLASVGALRDGVAEVRYYGQADPFRAPLLVSDIEVDPRFVPHGSWQDPADQSVAYRVRLGETTIVFGGDQNGTLQAFLDFADDAELLVMHLALSEQADPELRTMHAVPSIVARVARQAQVDRLLLSHIVDPPPDHPARDAFSGPTIRESIRDMRFTYFGPIDIASDLQCITF
jgi:ribonuclease BN (tRNA processing enzyme)